MAHLLTHVRHLFLLAALAFLASGDAAIAQSAATKLPDAVAADRRHYTAEFENDIVRVLRVGLPAGKSAPAHGHAAYCAIELSDSSLREGTGPVAGSKAGQVFCDDATSHAPQNVGKGLGESIVVQYKNRQRAR